MPKSYGVIYYWDPNGTGTPTSGTWDTSTPQWATTPVLTASPVVWNTAAAAGFPGGSANLNALTITVNSSIPFAGIFNGLTNGANNGAGVTNLTLTGTGTLNLNSGLQGFWTGQSYFNTIFRVPIIGTGGLQNQSSGSLYLGASNTYSGGTSIGTSAGLNFNNSMAFGTGTVTNSVATSVLATPQNDSSGTAFASVPITITNAWQTFGGANTEILVGFSGAPVTFTGPWTLTGAAGTATTLDVRNTTWTIAGPVSGPGNLTKINTATLVLSGANTFSGKTSINNGAISVGSLNKVTGGSASSNLGHPTSPANGTIGIGSTTTGGTLIYTGAGETTDRVIDLAGTTGGATIQNDGTGALIFSSDLTATGLGNKTLTLRGANTSGGTISGRIVNSTGNTTSVTKSDAGTWTLGGANTYTGTTTLNAGRLNLANAAALSTGGIIIGGNCSFDNLTGGNLTVANSITCSGGNPTYVGSANNMTINGAALITGANRTITVSANTLQFNFTLADSGQGRSLTKSGAGTLVLAGGTTYTGNTTISSGGGTLTVGNMSDGFYTGNIANSGTFNWVPQRSLQILGGAISGSGTLIVNGGGTLELTGTNTYTGATTINGGILALSTNGSLANGTSITIAAGGTLDVSGRTSPTYTLGTSATLTATGTGLTPGGNAATIYGASGGTVSLGSRPIHLTFTPTSFTGDTTHPSLVVGQGTLSLNGNSFTVNNAGGTPLDVGVYVVAQQTSGNVSSSGTCSASVTGSGITPGNTAYITVNGGSVNLVVAPTVSFSNLTSSQSITYGTAGILLSGTVSGAGPIYPAMGEPITVTINGNSQGTTINDATGDFSISYNPSAIPASGTPYAIAYSYPGNGTTTAAASDSGTALTVNAAASSLALASSQNPSAVGSNVTFTATATSGAGTPTGNVVFLTNGVPLATNALSAGVASASTSLLPLGTNTVTAQFAAQGNFLGSTDTLNQVINTGTVLSTTNIILSISNNADGTFTLNMLGTPQARYYLQAASDLTPPAAWSIVSGSTNTADTNGLWSYIVSNAAPAYYRSTATDPAH